MARSGIYLKCSVAGEKYQAFLPAPLPPKPPLDLAPLQRLMTRAAAALGRLDSVSDVLPDHALLLYYYIRKEAVLSSQIEGTQSSLSDLLLHESRESPATPIEDVAEVSRYVAALEHGLRRIEGGFPLSLRLIREMHRRLLSRGRGRGRQPGEFRRSQNWIGGARPGNALFVPPPPEHLMECLGHFEKYLHLEERVYPSLIDAGLVHAQFETIHPFLDGNGRIGRLLIVFLLIVLGDLKKPVLHISLFFRNNRRAYYEHLNAVRRSGDWKSWLEFFLTGVAETAEQAVETGYRISGLFSEDRAKVAALKRASQSALPVFELLQNRAILSANGAAGELGISAPTARAAFARLKNLAIVREISGRGKERLYCYSGLLDLLEKGVTPSG